MWCPAYSTATTNLRAITPRISLIAALDTSGSIHYSLTQANTDQLVMLAFLKFLSAQLDEEEPGWRNTTYILLDGARYHTGDDIREYIHRMRIKVIWSAPYSYSAAPIELLFAALKFGELNPERLSMGKKVGTVFTRILTAIFLFKALHNVGDIIGERLNQIPRSTTIRYWHHACLQLFHYLYFKRI